MGVITMPTLPPLPLERPQRPVESPKAPPRGFHKPSRALATVYGRDTNRPRRVRAKVRISWRVSLPLTRLSTSPQLNRKEVCP